MAGAKGGNNAQQPRKKIGGPRQKGVITEWKGTWGWVKPAAPIKHAEGQKNGGKIYLHSGDMRAGATAANGVQVEFSVYSDARGLGAMDVAKVGGAAKGAAGVEKLPPGWKKMFSEEHGEHYYWHAATKETSWEKPGGDDDADEDDDDELPLGWSKEWDEEQKQWYFWNKLTRTASWQKPRAKAVARKAAPPTHDEEEMDEETVRIPARVVDGPILGQQRMSGIVTKWEGMFGWIAPLAANVPADLKALLARSQDKVYVNWREVKDGIKLKVGVHVDFNIIADDNGLAAAEVTMHKAGKGPKLSAGEKAVEKLQKEWAQQDGKKATFAAPSKPKNYGVAEAAAGGDEADGELLPGWEACWSEEHQCNFYWHKASKSSSWERPAVPDEDAAPAKHAPAKRAAPAMDDRVWAGEGAQRGASRLATPMTPLINKPGRGMTPITPTTANMAANMPAAKRARVA